MIHDIINIELDYEKMGIEHKGAAATMTTYIKDMYPDYQKPFERPLVIICPGGGYGHHSPREGEAVAVKMLDMGYNAIVLRYSLMPNEFPCQLYEAAYAINYARQHAREWDINPDKVIIAGFSAGGHVAASLGTMWNQEELRCFTKDILGVEPEAVRPDGMLLGYPVITSGEYAHRGSFDNLIKEHYSELIDKVSLENRVTADTPQAFIWHTVTDGSVPVENSMLLASAMKKAGVSFELHLFPHGNHGLGLGTKETDTKDGTHYQPEVSVWTELFGTWMSKNITE